MQRDLFSLLSQGLEQDMRDANPWWRGEPIVGIPAMRRWAFEPVLNQLRSGLTPLAPAVVLR